MTQGNEEGDSDSEMKVIYQNIRRNTTNILILQCTSLYQQKAHVAISSYLITDSVVILGVVSKSVILKLYEFLNA